MFDSGILSALSEAAKLANFKEFCHRLNLEESLAFFLDSSKFSSMSSASAEQYNFGRQIYEKYFSSSSYCTISFTEKMRRKVKDDFQTSLEKKSIPSNIFSACNEKVLRIFEEPLKEFFNQNESIEDEEEFEECPFCIKRYNLLNRRKIQCSNCLKSACSNCVWRENNSSSSKICDICNLNITFQNPFAFSYMDKELNRPMYFITKSEQDSQEWMDFFQRSINSISKADKLAESFSLITRDGFSLKKKTEEISNLNHKEGWLAFEDLSSKRWVKRYAILKENRLWFFELELRGNIHLTQSVVHPTEVLPVLTKESANYGGFVSQSNFAYQILLKPDERVYYLAADSKNDQTAWIEKITLASTVISDGKELPYETVDHTL